MYQNTALNANIFVRALHCNSTELIALSLQIHILSTGCGNCLRLDACRRNLGYSRTFRGKRYILVCLYIRGNRNGILCRYDYVFVYGSQCAINCYTACFCIQCNIALRHCFVSYGNIASLRSQSNRTLCC